MRMKTRHRPHRVWFGPGLHRRAPARAFGVWGSRGVRVTLVYLAAKTPEKRREMIKCVVQLMCEGPARFLIVKNKANLNIPGQTF